MIALLNLILYGVGDSIFVGAGVSPTQRWFKRVCDYFQAIELNNGLSGMGIHTSTNGVAVFDPDSINNFNNTYGLAFIAFGVNDNIHGATPAQYKAKLLAAIDEYISKGWPLDRIVIISHYYIKYSQNYARMKEFVDAASEVATEKGTRFIDVFTPMQALSNVNALYYPDDEVHTNVEGHEKIAGFVIDAIGSFVTAPPVDPPSTATILVKKRFVIV